MGDFRFNPSLYATSQHVYYEKKIRIQRLKTFKSLFFNYKYCVYSLFCTLVRYSLGDIPSAALKHFEKYFGSEKPHP